MNRKIVLTISYLLLLSTVNAQLIEERTEFSNGYFIKKYNDNLELVTSEKYIENHLVERSSFNPNNGFPEGDFYDGHNEYMYDTVSLVHSDNYVYSVTKEYRKLTKNIYDEIIVVGLGIDKGAPDGKGKIVGFNYPRIQSYDPLGTYVMSSALGFKSPQYVYSRITNAKPTRIDTIGSFIMNDGVYTDTARLFVGDRRIEIAFGDYGTPVYYKENNNNIISEFKINSKFYKYNGELFFSPTIDANSHSFIKLHGELIKSNNNTDYAHKYAKYPFLHFDFLHGIVGMSIRNYQVDKYFSDYNSTKMLEMIYYDSNGIYYTLMTDGLNSKNYDGAKRTLPFEENNLSEAVPAFYYKVKVSPQYYYSGHNATLNVFDMLFEDRRGQVSRYGEPHFLQNSGHWSQKNIYGKEFTAEETFFLKGLNYVPKSPYGISKYLVTLNSDLFIYNESLLSDKMKLIEDQKEEAVIKLLLDTRFDVLNYSDAYLREFNLIKEKISTYPTKNISLPHNWFVDLSKVDANESLNTFTRNELETKVNEWILKGTQVEKPN